MSRIRPPLSEWRAALREVDRCPYVGPRPQTTSDEGMLIGRGEDLERITRAVLTRRLVVLHGYSGCGKSSLLQNGLFGRLGESNFAVLVGRQWGRLPHKFEGTSEEIESQVERYIAGAVRLTHENPLARLPVPDGVDLEILAEQGDWSRTLDQKFGESAVLILDQFEELLNQHDEETARHIVQWIVESGYRHDTHFVISLRTDSLHLLDPLLRGVKPFSMDRVWVRELTDPKAIKEVMETTGFSSGSTITDEAVDGLMELWMRHRPKMLDLQATLYALYFRAVPTDGAERVRDDMRIDQSEVLALEADACARDEDPFKYGLREAISQKIDHAEAACRRQGLDEYLVCGAREVIKRAAPFLSSRDFKVPIHEAELARMALGRELRVLEPAVTDELKGTSGRAGRRLIDVTLASLFDALREASDFLTVRVQELSSLECLRTAPAASTVADRPQTSRRDDVTAGPMMASTAVVTLLEEIRRVVFAIEWLVSTEILRRDPDGTLLLVHDGSGSALRAWAEAGEADPEHALRQLTGARGEHYVWADSEIGGDSYQVFANLNWRYCRVSARFRNVVFVNCDFRGSQFERCTFRGTTFVNCLLDDANFEYCEIWGPANLTPVARPPEEGVEATRVAPSFTVETALSEVRFFVPYPPYPEVNETEEGQLFSDTSGMPAVPGPQPSMHQGEVICHFTTGADSPATPLASSGPPRDPVNLRPASGGVAMVGGRLCMLTVYRCGSHEGGSFAFHHVSGDGFDLVEQDGGSVDIYDAAIRGISVSRDPDSASGARRTPRTRPIRLTVDESIVANVYFSDELEGSASFQHSVVLMLINAGENTENHGFPVEIKDCRYQFLVNANPPDGSVEDSRERDPEVRYFELVEGSHSRFDARNRRALGADLEAMDYRYRPEVWEELQRKRRARARAAAGGAAGRG